MSSLRQPIPAIVALALFVLSSPRPAWSQLIDNGDGTISDVGQQIMWLKDAGAASSMTYQEVQTWVAGLTVGGYTDWRLPSGTDPRSDPTASSLDNQYYYDAVGSEFGYLFYTELGGCAGWYIYTKCVGFTTAPNDDPDLLLFDNIPSQTPVNGTIYWTDMMSASSPGYAWTFSFNAGSYREQPIDETRRFRGWAVRDAVIAPPPVDVWIRDCDDDVGNTPSVPNPCPVAYMSPDIWIDNNDDMTIDAPVEGADNILKAAVRNRSAVTAEQVTVSFYYRDNTTGLIFPDGAEFIGSDVVTVSGGSVTVASTTWANLPSPPTTGGHWCIGVVLSHANDPPITPPVPAKDDNNVAIANIWHLAARAGEQMVLSFGAGSGGRSGFGLGEWPRDFVLRVNDELPAGWTWTLEGIAANEPFTLRLGEERQVSLTIDVPDDAPPHTDGAIDVRQVDVATGRVVGGVHFDVYEDHLPPQAVQTLAAALLDGHAVLTWDPVRTEVETGLRERVAYYEIRRDGRPVAKVVSDGDEARPGMQWTDPVALNGAAVYGIHAVDEGANVSEAGPEVRIEDRAGAGRLTWLLWLQLLLLLVIVAMLIIHMRRSASGS